MFARNALDLDWQRTTETIETAVRDIVYGRLRRRGVVVGMCGGIGSSVVATLCARSVGSEHVVGVFTPDYESSSDGLQVANLMANRLGIRTELVNIGSALEALGCYLYRDEAVWRVCSEFGTGWKLRLVVSPSGDAGPKRSRLLVQSPAGKTQLSDLPLDVYLQVVATFKMKARTRTLVEYAVAERLDYAVASSRNRLDYGVPLSTTDVEAADFMPIAHLYKTQVRALAEALGIPEEIRRQTLPDASSPAEIREDSHLGLSYDQMDLCLWAHDHSVPMEEAARVIGLEIGLIEQVFLDIEVRRQATRLRPHIPILVEEVPEYEARGSLDTGGCHTVETP